jgi:hypothetical protein
MTATELLTCDVLHSSVQERKSSGGPAMERNEVTFSVSINPPVPAGGRFEVSMKILLPRTYWRPVRSL